MPDFLPAFVALAPAVDAILGDALAPYALFSTQGRMIGEIAIDVPIREVHDDSYTATQHPTEAGSPISDHYFRQPRVCEMTCGFSDSTAGYQGYVQQVVAAFDALAATRQPFDVSTGKVQYSNMVILNKSIITDPQSEYALFITVRLQEVIVSAPVNGQSGPQGTPENQADPASTGTTVDRGTQGLQSTGTESETAASAKAATIAGYTTPVTTPQPAVGGIGGISPGTLTGGIGSA